MNVIRRILQKIENFAYGEIKERNFSNPHPWIVIDLANGMSFIGTEWLSTS